MRSVLVHAIALLMAIALTVAPAAAQQTRRFLYVAVPGAGNETEYRGVGILVYDIDNGHKFVKRIPTWPVATGQQPEQVRGIAASARHAASVHQHSEAACGVRSGDREDRLGEDLRRHLLRSPRAVSRWRDDLRAGVRRAEVVRDRCRERLAAGNDRRHGMAAAGDLFAATALSCS